jgi:hypothetical protein
MFADDATEIMTVLKSMDFTDVRYNDPQVALTLTR